VIKKWNIKNWESVLTINNGRNQKNVTNPNGKYPIYGSGGIMGYADDYICNEGSIIIGRKGSINNPIYVTTKFWNIDTAFGLSPSDSLDSKFLYYFCLGYDFTKHDKGTTLPSLTKTDLLNVSMPLPPLLEQKRIVAILDEAFEGIDRAISNTEKNLSNARELFESYLNSIFSQKGEGWEFENWESVLTINNGRSQKNVTNPNGKYPIYGSGGIMGYADNYICNEGSTIIGRKGSINNPIYVTTKFWNIDTAFGLSPLDSLDSKFLYYFCLGYDFTKHDKGTTLPSLTKKDLLNVSMPLLPLPEQKNIVNKLDKIYTKTQRIENIYRQKIAALKELKQSILQKAFTGELTADNPKIEEWEVAA